MKSSYCKTSHTIVSKRQRGLRRVGVAMALGIGFASAVSGAQANGLGENFDWQFQTVADKAAMTAIRLFLGATASVGKVGGWMTISRDKP